MSENAMEERPACIKPNTNRHPYKLAGSPDISKVFFIVITLAQKSTSAEFPMDLDLIKPY